MAIIRGIRQFARSKGHVYHHAGHALFFYPFSVVENLLLNIYITYAYLSMIFVLNDHIFYINKIM